MPDDKVRFLAVDDLANNIAAVKGLLAREGLEILSATSGAEALELLLRYDFALALIDVQMPEMDGFELAGLMRGTERTRHIPIIFITAVATDEQRRFRGYELGAIDYVIKPIEPQVLRNKADLFFRLERKRLDLLHRTEELRQLHQRLAAHTENSPLATIEFDPEYRITFWSSGAERMFVWSAAEVIGKRITELRVVHEDDAESVAALSADMVAGKTSRNVYSTRNYRKDETIIDCEWYNSTLHDESGKLISVRSQVLDVTQRKRAEETQAKLAAIVTGSADAIIGKTSGGVITSWNQSAERIFGYAAEDMIGNSIRALIPPERQDEEEMILTRIAAGERIENYETVRIARDGRQVDVSITVSPMSDGQGRVVGASTIMRDITENKRAQEHKEILLNELNHRVKNTLAAVQAIATQTFKGSELSDKAVAAFHGRLSALARANDILIWGNWENADLQDLVRQAVIPHGGNELERFRIEGNSVRLNPKAAVAMAMGLHELCTNAAKYGALSRPEGRVSIIWSLGNTGAQPRLCLRWEESGGPRVEIPKRKGFGSRLIETFLAAELEGQIALDYKPAGLACTLDAPLPAIVCGG